MGHPDAHCSINLSSVQVSLLLSQMLEELCYSSKHICLNLTSLLLNEIKYMACGLGTEGLCVNS